MLIATSWIVVSPKRIHEELSKQLVAEGIMLDLFKFKTLSVMHPDVEDRLTYGPDFKPQEDN